MASNESKVLDPAAPVDTLPRNAAGRALNRRNLVAGLSIAGAAMGIDALGIDLFSRWFPSRPGVVEASTTVPTGFNEVDYLNFLLNLKYLQATFYSFVTQATDIPGASQGGAAPATITAVSATATTVTVTAANNYAANQSGVIISGLTGVPVTITNVTATAATVTVAASNSFLAGQSVVIAGLTATLAGYNGTFTVATANATGFTFSFASAGVASTPVPSGATATLSLPLYNGTFTLASATSTNFTIAIAGPVLASTTAAGGAFAVTGIPPYTINGAPYLPNLGTNLLYEPLSAAPVFTTFVNGAQIIDMLKEIYYDEINQLINLQTLVNAQVPSAVTLSGPIGTGAIVRPPMDLLGKNSTSTTATTITPQKALAQMRLLEDLSVTALAGVAQYLTGANLTAAMQILAVDGTHAGALRLAIIQWNANNTAANAVIDLVADSDIVPAQAGAFWQVQSDDVAPVDLATPAFATALATGGPQKVTVPVQFSATQNVINPCTAPIIPFAEVYTITSVAATTAVVTIQAANSFTSGQTGVVVAGLTGALAAYNGTFTLTSVSSTQFTYALATAGIASTPTSTGTATSSASAYTSCTPTQYQSFFATTGALTANGTTPAGFAFARTPSQVLSVLYASSPGATPQAPALPSPNTNPLPASGTQTAGGFFPTVPSGSAGAVGGVINVIVY
jgi:hypothetical protein